MSSVLEYTLPVNWIEDRLENLISLGSTITYGVVQPGPEDEQGVPFVRGGDIYNGKIAVDKLRTISQDVSKEYKRTLLEGGELLMSLVGYPGEVAIVPSELKGANIARQAAYIKLDEKIDNKYLMYYLLSEIGKFFLFQKSTGSAQQVINLVELKDVNIILPPLAQQQKIAKILSTVDNLIEKTQTLIDKYTAIKQGMMADLFTRGIDMASGDTPNSKGGKLRPSVEDAPKLYKQTELGWVPKEWEVKRLEDLLAETPSAMRSGPFGSSLLKHELVEKGIPLLGIDNIFVERFSGTYRRFVTPEKFKELSKYAVRPNDVVITIMGTVGRCCVVPDDIEKALSSKHLWTMTFDKQKVISDLVCWQLNYADWAKSWFHQKSQGGIMEAIQSSTLKNLLLPVPKLDEQLKIAEIYSNLSAKIEKEGAYLNKLLLKKKGLMQDLLTGKVKVK